MLFPDSNITGNGSPGTVWLDALDPLFAIIGKKFLSKAIRDFGKTGYYEADGFFGTSSAPWMAADSSNDDTDAFGGLPSTHCSPALTGSNNSRSLGLGVVSTVGKVAERKAALPACVFGSEQKMRYIAGYVTDHGKIYPSLHEAKAACQQDTFCGGVLSRSCNANNTVCTAFQTRSGMSPCPNAGVPCPGDLPKLLPEPV